MEFLRATTKNENEHLRQELSAARQQVLALE
jgi:hypothetical protein